MKEAHDRVEGPPVEVSPYSTAITIGNLGTQIRPFEVEFLRTS
jgi:hypothetical protein